MKSSQPPEAPPPPIALARAWLSRYEHCVRQRDYAKAKSLFHNRVVCFGLGSDLTVDLDQTVDREWREVWPSQLAFTFDQSKCSVIPEGSLILVSALWTARSLIAGAPPKRGRATVALMTFTNKKTLCVHLHMSAASGVKIE